MISDVTVEKYFILSDGDEPDALYFDLAVAQALKHNFIDSFDSSGRRVAQYELDLVTGEYVKYDI